MSSRGKEIEINRGLADVNYSHVSFEMFRNKRAKGTGSCHFWTARMSSCAALDRNKNQ